MRVVNGGGRAGEGGCLTVGTAGLGDRGDTVSRILYINHKSRIALAVRVGWVLLPARIFVIGFRFRNNLSGILSVELAVSVGLVARGGADRSPNPVLVARRHAAREECGRVPLPTSYRLPDAWLKTMWGLNAGQSPG